MKLKKMFLGLSGSLLIATMVAGVAKPQKLAEVRAGEKTSYSLFKEFYDYFTPLKSTSGSSHGYLVNGTSMHWGVEAITLGNMWNEEGCGFNSSDANGTFGAIQSPIPGDWDYYFMSGHSYPVKITYDWVRGYEQSQYFYSGWQPWGARNWDSTEKIGDDCWPCGKYVADTEYLMYFVDLFGAGTSAGIHLGVNIGFVFYFVAPKSGQVYIQDHVETSNYPASSDGIYMCGYKIPKATYDLYAKDGHQWHTEPMHGLFGGTPFYPEQGVVPTANYTDGWKSCGASCDIKKYVDVQAGDVLALIYSGGPSISADLSSFKPEVVYDDATPLTTVKNFEQNELKASTIPYTDHSGTGACLGSTGYYQVAKTAYQAFTADEKEIFDTYPEFAKARARFNAWATANGDTPDSINSAITNRLNLSNSTISEPIVITVAVTAALFTTVLYIKKRKTH